MTYDTTDEKTVNRVKGNKGKFKVVALPRFERVCPNCGVVFLTDNPQKKYCSRRCQNTAAIRRYRQRRRGLL